MREPASLEDDGRPLRVCIVTAYVTQHSIGGMQQHTDDLARGLVAAGHDVTILTARAPLEPAPPENVAFEMADAEPPASVYDRRWGEASARLFMRLHAKQPFDVVHSEGAGARGLVNHRLDTRVPVTVMYHGNWLGFVRAELRASVSGHPRWLRMLKAFRHSFDMSRIHFGQGHWQAFRRLESMVPSESHVDDTVRSHLLSRERTHVVPNGIDVRLFHPGRNPGFRDRIGVPADALLLMTLGRLAPDKGLDRALRAFAVLPRQDVYLAVVGEGEQESELRRLAERLGIAARVRLPGPVPQAEASDTLRAADVFWFPTVRDEAAPLVVPQALACGVPVVASRIGGIPDAIRGGEEGILIPAGDPDALAAATVPLLAHEEARLRIGAAGRRRAVEEFSIETMVERTVEVYRLAISRRGG
jgi:glycosyltransferase involved in cell wall biosynthesis